MSHVCCFVKEEDLDVREDFVRIFSASYDQINRASAGGRGRRRREGGCELIYRHCSRVPGRWSCCVVGDVDAAGGTAGNVSKTGTGRERERERERGGDFG